MIVKVDRSGLWLASKRYGLTVWFPGVWQPLSIRGRMTRIGVLRVTWRGRDYWPVSR